MKENTKANEDWNKAVEACTTAEDYFNLALEQCNSDAERQQLVMHMLASQGLAEAGKAWRENNQDIVAVNEATAEYDAALGRLGETLAPVGAALLNFAADAIGAVIDACKDASDWYDTLFRKAKDTKALTTGLAADAAKTSSGTKTVTATEEEAALMRSMKKTQSTGSAAGTSASGGTEIIQTTVKVELDGRVVGQSVAEYQKTQRRMGG